MFKRLRNNKGFVFTGAVAGLTALGVSGTAATTGLAAAGLAGAGFAGAKVLGNILNPKQKNQALPSPDTSKLSEEAAANKARDQVNNRRRAIKRNQTISTSPLGLTPADKSNLNLKTLTGS